MRKPPRVLRILGQRVEVTTAAHVEREGDFEELQGHMDLAGGFMAIGTHQSPDQVADTFLHECLHFMLQLIGHDDEKMVWRLSPVLMDFMRRNPRAVEFIMGEPFRVVRW